MTKLFLGGISPLTSTEVIRDHFNQYYGEVLDAIAMQTRDGKHRGFGFVTLESEEAAEIALAEEVVIDGRVIDMKRADGKGGPDGPRAPAPRAEEFGFGAAPPRPTSACGIAPIGAPIGAGGYGAGSYGGYGKGGHGQGPPLATRQGACGSHAEPEDYKRGKGGESNKIFVGGLSRDTTDDNLRDYFSQFGELTDCVVIRDPETKRPRGFGFITYDDPESVDMVMESYEKHQIAGKWVEVKRATARDAAPPSGMGGRGPPMMPPHHAMGGKQFGAPKGGFIPMTGPMAPPMAVANGNGASSGTHKIFVGGISSETTDDILHEYFSRYGTLVDCVAMKDKATQKPRGFGFVEYDNADSVEAVMQDYGNHEIDGKRVEVKRAAAKPSAPSFGGPPPMMEMRRPSPVGPTSIYADKGGYGPRTTGRTFLPRAHMGPYSY